MSQSSIRIAFIAKYAPPVGSSKPCDASNEDIVYSKYHFDIYRTLAKHFPNLVTGTNAQFIIDNHSEIDYIFSLLNRDSYRNSEIFISALAEFYKIPYLGCRPNIRALAEDKHMGKMMAIYCGLSTPKWEISDVDCEDLKPSLFPAPYFVKPRYGASSKNIDENSICDSWEEATKRIQFLHNLGEDAIIEEFVNGVFYSSPVIFSDGCPIVLPAIREESNMRGNVVTYKQKRKTESGLVRIVETDNEIQEEIRKASMKLIKNIAPIDYFRADYMYDGKHLHFLEFNVCCNLGVQSAFVLSARKFGLEYENLVLSILRESFRRQKII